MAESYKYVLIRLLVSMYRCLIRCALTGKYPNNLVCKSSWRKTEGRTRPSCIKPQPTLSHISIIFPGVSKYKTTNFDFSIFPTFLYPRHSRKCIYVTIILLVLSFTGAVIMLCTNWFDSTVQKIITLSNGTYIFGLWRDTDFEIIVHVYPFNYTNVEAILAGTEKPVLKQIGPYVFRQNLLKWNVAFQGTERIKYSENVTNTFLREDSNGCLEDVIYTPNILLITLLNAVKGLNLYTQLTVSTMLKSFKIQPFMKMSMQDLILGYDEKVTVLSDIVALIDQEIPPSTGLLSNRIGVLPDEITIGTGIPDLGQIGIIQEYNGKDRMDVWDGEECNNITSSDGTLFPAESVRSGETLYFFRRVVCRRFPFVFQKETTTNQGYPVRRYILPEDVYSYGNSHNKCFCKGGTCPPSGTFSVGPCYYDAPIFISKPHFMDGDKVLLEDVEGLSPDPEKHTFYLDLHDAGIIIAGKAILQVGVYLNKARYVSIMNEMKDGIALPVGLISFTSTDLTGIPNVLIYHLTYTVPIVKLFLQCSLSILFLILLTRLFLYFYSCSFVRTISNGNMFSYIEKYQVNKYDVGK